MERVLTTLRLKKTQDKCQSLRDRGALGHASEQTTRDIYLAPVSDLQVRSLLTEDDDPGVAELLTRIAAASDRVQDTALDSGDVA